MIVPTGPVRTLSCGGPTRWEGLFEQVSLPCDGHCLWHGVVAASLGVERWKQLDPTSQTKLAREQIDRCAAQLSVDRYRLYHSGRCVEEDDLEVISTSLSTLASLAFFLFHCRWNFKGF